MLCGLTDKLTGRNNDGIVKTRNSDGKVIRLRRTLCKAPRIFKKKTFLQPSVYSPSAYRVSHKGYRRLTQISHKRVIPGWKLPGMARNIISSARAARTGSCLGIRWWFIAWPASHGKICRAYNPLKFFAPAFRAFQLRFLILIHQNEFKKLIAFRTFEFIYRHKNSSVDFLSKSFK